MLLFVDTETSGLIDFAQPTDHPSQPHIVQLAALLCDDDEDCTVRETYQSIIRPDGWEIQTAAEAVQITPVALARRCRAYSASSTALSPSQTHSAPDASSRTTHPSTYA
jgi:hypothetical protein